MLKRKLHYYKTVQCKRLFYYNLKKNKAADNLIFVMDIFNEIYTCMLVSEWVIVTFFCYVF